MSDTLDPVGQHMVSALKHLRGADHDLRMVLTLLRQEKRDVPAEVEDTLACVKDALEILDA